MYLFERSSLEYLPSSRIVADCSFSKNGYHQDTNKITMVAVAKQSDNSCLYISTLKPWNFKQHLLVLVKSATHLCCMAFKYYTIIICCHNFPPKRDHFYQVRLILTHSSFPKKLQSLRVEPHAQLHGKVPLPMWG